MKTLRNRNLRKSKLTPHPFIYHSSLVMYTCLYAVSMYTCLYSQCGLVKCDFYHFFSERNTKQNSFNNYSIKTLNCEYILIYCGLCHAQGSRYSDSLRTGRSGDQFPVEAKFFAPLQTGPGAHPPFYTMGTGSFPGVKRPERGVEPPSGAKVKESVELYIYTPTGLSWPVLKVNFTLTT